MAELRLSGLVIVTFKTGGLNDGRNDYSQI
jgi:hypothetical protein